MSSWLINLGGQTGYYGLALWAPALIVAILGVGSADAARRMMLLTAAALVGRILVAFLSDRFGRRRTGIWTSFGAAGTIVLTGYAGDATLGVVPLLIALLMLASLLCDGQFAVVGPYSAEVWPADLRSTGMARRHRVRADRHRDARAHDRADRRRPGRLAGRRPGPSGA